MKTKKIVTAIALTSLLSAGANADFINGGFEDISSTLVGWTVKQGRVKGGGQNSAVNLGQDNVDWCIENGVDIPGQSANCFGFAHLNPNAQVVDSNFFDHYVSDFNNILQGDQKSLLNWQPSGLAVIGNNHATQLSQKAKFAPSDLGPDGKLNIYVLWGGYIENPGHDPEDQPFFEITIKRGEPNGQGGYTWTKIKHEFQVAGAPGSDWLTHPTTGAFYKKETVGFELDKTTLTLGADGFYKQIFEIELTTADCALGGHGAYAWLDYVGTQCGNNGVPCPDTKVNHCVIANDEVYIKDFGTINNAHLAGGRYFEMGFGSKLNGNAWVNGNSRLMEQAKLTGDLTLAGALTQQPNVTITGTLTENTSTSTINVPTRSVSFGTTSVIADNSGICHQTLAPGNYLDVWVRQNCSLTLSSGNYNMRELIFESGARFVIDASPAAPLNVNTDRVFRFGDGVVMAAKTGTISAESINLYTNQTEWMHFGGQGQFFGTLTAPNANLSVFQGNEFNGCLKGKNVFVEPRGVINGISTSTSVTNFPPVAKLTVSGTPNVGQAITFDSAGSSDPEGKSLSYAWTINGNAEGTSAKLVKTFTVAGTYTIKLTVTDADGASVSATETVTITSSNTGGCTTVDLGAQNNVVMATGNGCFKISANQLPGDQWWHPGAIVLSLEPSDGQQLTGSTDFTGSASSIGGWSQSLTRVYPWPKADITFTVTTPSNRL